MKELPLAAPQHPRDETKNMKLPTTTMAMKTALKLPLVISFQSFP